DLDDEFGLHPSDVARPGSLRWRVEGALGRAPGLEFHGDRRARGVAEAGADAPTVDEASCSVVMTEQEGAEVLRAAGGSSEAADDELLPMEALDLQPGPRAPLFVAAVDAFGDDALQGMAAGVQEDAVALVREVLAETQRSL